MYDSRSEALRNTKESAPRTPRESATPPSHHPHTPYTSPTYPTGSSEKTYYSRSKALEAFKKSKEYREIPNHFPQEPKARPEYIPPSITRGQTKHTVVFYQNTYGYWHDAKFFSITTNDFHISDPMLSRYNYYYYPRSSASGGVFLFLGILVLVSLAFGVVFLIIYATTSRKQKEEEIESTPVDETIQNSFLRRLYGLQKGKIVTLSDPLTLASYNKPIDFVVGDTITYRHLDFQIFHATLENNTDGEPLTLHLFAKEVHGDFALFLGELDHEGSNSTLQEEDWKHLDESEDRFSQEFHALFPSPEKGKETLGTFTQYEFGGYYDVQSSKSIVPMAICEYYPQDAPPKFDWQHVIVTWQGDWVSCYYCIEIHERNLSIY
jgi:hypothetical protein